MTSSAARSKAVAEPQGCFDALSERTQGNLHRIIPIHCRLVNRIWVLYPEYFESGRSRLKGRRVNRRYSFARLSCRDIYEAALALGLGPVMEERHHPTDWHDKRGRVLVRKEFPKEETIRLVAGEIRRKRDRDQACSGRPGRRRNFYQPITTQAQKAGENHDRRCPKSGKR